jgi:acyl-coenzyme A thioesterase 13
MASSPPLAGNAPESIKAATAYKWYTWFGGPEAPGFGRDVRKNVRFTTLDMYEGSASDGHGRTEGKGKGRRCAEAVHEAKVTEEMLNAMGFLHGGCTAYMIDMCVPRAGPSPSIRR